MKFKPRSFEFSSYEIDSEKSEIIFFYKLVFFNVEPIEFSEKISFNKSFSIEKIPKDLLAEVLNSVHIALGISYYKSYCPKEIKLGFSLTRKQADFWNAVYKNGLGEFFYQNDIDFNDLINFPFNKEKKTKNYCFKRKNRSLIGIGGGKDSIVAAELLRENSDDITAFLVESQRKDQISRKVIDKMGINSIIISRSLDDKIFNMPEESCNGHIPISSIFAFLGYLTSILYDYSQVIVANEFSSNFGNTYFKGEEINHQWSKSIEFENLFQEYTRYSLCPDVIYFSLTRQFHEIRVVEMFSKYRKYFPIFTSCNRNFRIQKNRPDSLWCGECPKCVFNWIMLSAFLEKDELISIFKKNLYDDEKLLTLFENILGYGKMKPFDCVGTFEESQAAIAIAKKNFSNSIVIESIENKFGIIKVSDNSVFKTSASSAIPDIYKLYGIKNVLIAGHGKEGQISERYLKKYFPNIEIGIADEKQGKDYLDNQSDYDLAIRTPGLRKETIKIPYTTATNLFFSKTKNNLKIGVTGSKGKSTTASLIFSILKSAGKKVRLLGNIGEPMLELLLNPLDDEEILIVEISSYQLDDIHYSPNISVITNLFSDHMNYHGSANLYYSAKRNATNYQNSCDFFVYNGLNDNLNKWSESSMASGVDFSKIKTGDIQTVLLGEHNLENIKAAIAVANILDVPKDLIKAGIKEFSPLKHRLEFVGKFMEINFYNDANATIPEATISAIKSIPEIETIFLGGLDRGYDFSELVQAIHSSKIKNIVFFPKSGKKIEKVLRKIENGRKYNVLHTENIEKAVAFAYQQTKNGKSCILSTASPSYGIWKNFKEKGEKYEEAIIKLSKKN